MEDAACAPRLLAKPPTVETTAVLERSAAADPKDSFVRVVAALPATGIQLVLPNGVRLECPADLGSDALAALIETVSRL